MSAYVITHMDMDMSPCLHIITHMDHMDLDMAPCLHISLMSPWIWIWDPMSTYYCSHGSGYDSMSANLSLLNILSITGMDMT